ncbi:hypothetical protein Pyn_07082 [Prunus yedoensis var. nudiflora]|uniref:Uncharacterized protein n=1 Tax=Prunus yedoensis var. nudiflora TaxID=2094558 RepID=A0A314ZKR3_PRUYE|nr:hypothetical protein Pyn_07082 [Prunus yedoensis var. nudiflora]
MSPHQVEFCYLQSAVGKIIESNPSTQKTWKPHWFYASGSWEFAEGVELSLYIFAVELERAELSAVEQEQVDQILALPSTEKAADKLLVSERLISTAAMRPSRNDPAMQAQLMKMAKGSSGGSTMGSQPTRVGVSPHMSVARSHAPVTTASLARGGQKR